MMLRFLKKIFRSDAPSLSDAAPNEISLPPLIETACHTAVFIGYTQKRPTDHLENPLLISGIEAYYDSFGHASEGHYCTESVELFFQHGGRSCYVISLGGFNDPVNLSAFQQGLSRSASLRAQLLLVPDMVNLPDQEFFELQQQLLDHCRQQDGRFAILSTKGAGASVSADCLQYRKHTHARELYWGACYYPWIFTGQKEVPPIGAVAGLFARIEITMGIWADPSDLMLCQGLQPSRALGSQEMLQLQVDLEGGLSINTISTDEGGNCILRGNRTLAGNDPEWRFIASRRFVSSLQQSVYRWAQKIQAAPWGKPSVDSIHEGISSFLEKFRKKAAFKGNSAESAYFVNLKVEPAEAGVALFSPHSFVRFSLPFFSHYTPASPACIIFQADTEV